MGIWQHCLQYFGIPHKQDETSHGRGCTGHMARWDCGKDGRPDCTVKLYQAFIHNTGVLTEENIYKNP